MIQELFLWAVFGGGIGVFIGPVALTLSGADALARMLIASQEKRPELRVVAIVKIETRTKEENFG